jgi:hypothetical protein
VKPLRYSRPHHLGKLHDELLAAVPELAALERDDGSREAVFTLSGDGSRLELQVPDDLDQKAIAAIAAVVDAHEPSPPPPPASTVNEQAMRQKLEDRLAELRTLTDKINSGLATPLERERFLVLAGRTLERLARLELDALDDAV